MYRKSWKYDVLAIVLILCVIFFAARELQKEGFTVPSFSGQNVTFLSAYEASEFMMSDPDNYVHTLNIWDLRARNAMLEIDYRRASAHAAREFSPSQKQRLISAAHKADAFFKKYATSDTCEFDISKIVDIPWIFALTEGKAYEDGLPHTRANIIWLSTIIDETPSRLYKVLVHEKVHIFQRLYPELTNHYIKSLGYKQWKYRQGVPRIRSNPDLDPWIYIDPRTESPMMELYATDDPKNITDTVNKYSDYEHPYELMAYTIDKKASESAL